MYVVTGATGNTGGAAARYLLRRGCSVRVIVRSSAAATAWQLLGASTAITDLEDSIGLTVAFQNAEAVYVMHPPACFSGDVLAVAALRQAIERSGIVKVIALSSIGAHLSSRAGAIYSSWILERDFGTLDVSLAFIRPAYFLENWGRIARSAIADGVAPSFLVPLDRPIPTLSALDCGEFVAKTMLENWSGRRVIEVKGPLDYSPNDIAYIYGRLLGKYVEPVAIPESEWGPRLALQGFHANAIAAWTEMFRGFNSGAIRFEMPRPIIHGDTLIGETIEAAIRRETNGENHDPKEYDPKRYDKDTAPTA